MAYIFLRFQSIRAAVCALFVAVGVACFSPAAPVRAALPEYGGLQSNSSDDAVTASTFRRLAQRAQDCVRSSVDDLMIGAAEVMLTGPDAATVADMLKDVAAACVHARDAGKLLRSGKFKTPGDIKRGFSRRHGLDDYGKKGSLSERARRRRLDPKRPVSGNRNVAVAEYEQNGQIKYMTRVSRGTGQAGHSERVLIRDLPKDAKVRRVYSERHPCGEGCFQALNKDKRFENATREFSFDHRTVEENQRWLDMAENNFPAPDKPFLKMPGIPGF
jgi:hypothetical protein